MSETTKALVAVPGFPDSERYAYEAHLGKGGMGMVFRARDRQTGAVVALKTLTRFSPSALLELKREFRGFQHLSHPNLVTLFDLVAGESFCFFTMELVNGVDWLDYVRPLDVDGVDRLEEEKVRATLPQIVLGLSYLHGEGKLHRDVKPNNIIVSEKDGRVVLLDFGISVDAAEMQSPNELLGTPIYLAPEVIVGKPATPASDLYAVGIVLFEALTGASPFEGNLVTIFRTKLSGAIPRVRDYAPRAPADLADLCEALIARDPAVRPTAAQVASVLAGTLSGPVPNEPKSRTMKTPFVGRRGAITTLQRSLDQLRATMSAQVVYVYGESGIGKTALVEHFLSGLVRENDVLCLTGRCLEPEVVPFKGIDGIVDAASRYLAPLDPVEASVLLPDHADLLAETFPVLRQSPAFATGSTKSPVKDPQERRSNMFAAFRQFFAKLAERKTLIFTIDDLQWADADSMLLLAELLRNPGSPAILLIAMVRTDRTGSVMPSQRPQSRFSMRSWEKPIQGESIWLTGLLPDEARALVAAVAFETSEDPLSVDDIVDDANGHPLFLAELAQKRGDADPSSLDEALAARIAEHGKDAGRCLAVLASSARPLPEGVLRVASGLGAQEFPIVLRTLRASKLLRGASGATDEGPYEPYHDRIRQVVKQHLSEVEEISIHGKLASALQAAGVDDPEWLSIHWYRSGNLIRAIELAERAGDRAFAALAFERAVRTYADATEWEGEKASAELRTKLGEALLHAGRSKEAADVFLQVAEKQEDVASNDLRRRAASLLLQSGHVDEGVRELESLIVRAGLTAPKHARGALTIFLLGRARIKLRRMFKAKLNVNPPADVLSTLSIAWAATIGFIPVDQLRSLAFQVQHYLRALDAGDPMHLCHALVMEGIGGVVLEGTKAWPALEACLSEAARYAENVPSAQPKLFVEAARASASFLSGNWLAALSCAEEADKGLRAQCTGVAWELNTVRQAKVWSLGYLGRLKAMRVAVDAGLRETSKWGDLYSEVSLRSGIPNLVWLLEDDAARATQQTDQALSQWSREGFHTQHLCDLVARANIALYSNNASEMLLEVNKLAPVLESSGVLRVELNRMLVADLHARLLIATAGKNDDTCDRLAEVIKTLAKQSAPWAKGLVFLYSASLAILRKDSGSQSEEVEKAFAVFASLGMELHAHAAKWVLADLQNDDRRSQTMESVDAYFAREGVQKPHSFAAMIAPILRVTRS